MHIGITLQLRDIDNTDLDQLKRLVQYKTTTDRHSVESSGDEQVKIGSNPNTNTLSADSQHNRWSKSPPSVQRINLSSNRHQSAGNQAGITRCHRNQWLRGCVGLLSQVKYQNAILLSKQRIEVYNHILPHTNVKRFEWSLDWKTTIWMQVHLPFNCPDCLHFAHANLKHAQPQICTFFVLLSVSLFSLSHAAL